MSLDVGRGFDWYEPVGISIILLGLYSLFVSYEIIGGVSFSNTIISMAAGFILLIIGSEVRSHFEHLRKK